MIHTGFTGTQRGVTPLQGITLRKVLSELEGWLHHGDCVGADKDAHEMARQLGKLQIVTHPPIKPDKRAWCDGDLVHQPAEYLDRNKGIIHTIGALIACPGEMTEQLRSGTWSTVRYARKLGRPITLVMPDGSVREERAADVSTLTG